MKSLTILLAVASLLIFIITIPAEAGVEVLNPYTGIVWKSGSTEKITWKENNNAPLLTSLKSLTITLMAGKQDAQFPAAVIASGVDGSSLSMSYTVPKSVGPQGDFYFLKFSQDSYSAYSGYFTIEGVSGTIPNFDPKNPGASTTRTTSSSSSTSSTSTTSLDSTSTTSSTTDLSPTPTSKVAAKSVTKDSETTKTQAPVPKSSSNGNKLATSFSALSLTLFVIAFCLF